MSPSPSLKHRISAGAGLLLVVLAQGGFICRASAEQIICPAVQDNTIFQDNNNSNGAGAWLAAGKINAGQIQRGLLRFDLSTVPATATITGATLNLYVVGVPKSDKGNQRFFWLRALEEIGEPSWGEGSSDAQDVGQGIAAAPGDATWSYKQYDTSPWPAGKEGALGPGPLSYSTSLAAGYVPANIDPVAAPVLVSWTKDLPTEAMVADIQAWVDGTMPNLGWALVGEEAVAANTSSKRQFASREADPALRPTLTVRYTPVPEPSTWLLCLTTAAALAGGVARAKRGVP